MIIGVILSILLLILVPVVLKRMKIPKYNEYTAPKVFSRAGELVNRVFNLGNVIKQSQKNSEYKGQLYQNIDSSSDSQLPEPITNDEYDL